MEHLRLTDGSEVQEMLSGNEAWLMVPFDAIPQASELHVYMAIFYNAGAFWKVWHLCRRVKQKPILWQKIVHATEGLAMLP